MAEHAQATRGVRPNPNEQGLPLVNFPAQEARADDQSLRPSMFAPESSQSGTTLYNGNHPSG